MRRSIFAATASAVVLLAAAGPSLAQSAPELRIGAEVQGQLNDQDASTGAEEGEYRYEEYRFRARSGQRLEAILRSDAFDAYLEVFGANREDGPLASDDDGLGDGTHSRLRFTAPSSGTFTLRARTLSGLDGGAFTLSLKERPRAARAPRPAGIRLGASVQGALADTDPESDDEIRYDAYAFRARANQRFAISLNAEGFDPLVRVGQMQRGAFVELAQNDDASAGGLNSYLVFTAPRNGDYIIRATPLGTDGVGAYTLALAEGPPPLAAQSLTVGSSVSGDLNENDGVNDTGVRADAYRFSAAAGQRIEATLNSDAFDAYLELFNAAGESVDQDDDGGEEGTNARLTHTAAEAGEYTLQVRAIGDTLTGAYTLALAEAAPEPAPSTLPFGQVIQGEIGEGDPRDDESRAFDAYTFSGTEGNRVQIVMRSGDFDTYLQVGRPGEAFEALGSDDDGLGEGTDSRLNHILPETGDYVVRASPLGSEEDGLYSIELTDRGPQPAPGSVLIGDTARGSLTDTDAIAEDGSYYDAYAFQVAEGEKLRITMVSNDFDAFLEVGRDGDGEGGAWESLVSDDDSLSDTHAKIEWTAETGGTYVLRARSFAQGQLGAYALTVERKP